MSLPRATVWVFPLIGCDEDSAGPALVCADGVLSPIITPGRMCEICCSNLRISCERASILAFCSSIFFVRASSRAASDVLTGSGEGVCAEAVESNKPQEKTAAQNIAASFMVPNVGISSFVWQAVRLQMRSLPFQHLLLNFFMPERIQKPVEPAPWGPKQGDGGGPRSPDVSRPDTKDLLKKMRKVDPNQSKRYRQRTGQ